MIFYGARSGRRHVRARPLQVQADAARPQDHPYLIRCAIPWRPPPRLLTTCAGPCRGDILEAAFDAAASAARGPGRPPPAAASGRPFEAAHLAVPYQADQMVQECVGMAVLGAPDRLACAAAHKAAVDALFKRFGDDTLASRRMSVLGATEGPWKERLAVFRAMLESALDAARSVRAGKPPGTRPRIPNRRPPLMRRSWPPPWGVRASRAVRRRTAFDAAAAATLEAAARNPRPPGAADALDGAIAAALPGPAREDNPAEAASEVAGRAREGRRGAGRRDGPPDHPGGPLRGDHLRGPQDLPSGAALCVRL